MGLDVLKGSRRTPSISTEAHELTQSSLKVAGSYSMAHDSAASAAETEAAAWLAEHDVAATVHGHAGHDAQAIYALLSERSPNAIIVDRQGALGRLIDIAEALERPTASVFVVG